MGEHAEPPQRAPLPGRLRVMGVVALAAVLFLACGHFTPLPIVDHAPASTLSLAIVLDDSSGSLFPTTVALVTVNVVSGGHAVALSRKQRLTCNGVTLSQPSPDGGLTARVNLPPAGGSYMFTYTDEQGHTTTFSVPAIAPLALISPTPGAAVAIPRPVAPISTPALSDIPPGTRVPDLAHVPLTVRYALPSLPPGSVTTVSMDAACATARAWDGCGLVEGRVREPATGVYTISDTATAYSYGFETFVPGPGSISSTLWVTWEQVTAFQRVNVTYRRYTATPVIWAAS